MLRMVASDNPKRPNPNISHISEDHEEYKSFTDVNTPNFMYGPVIAQSVHWLKCWLENRQIVVPFSAETSCHFLLRNVETTLQGTHFPIH